LNAGFQTRPVATQQMPMMSGEFENPKADPIRRAIGVSKLRALRSVGP
jgi:hypothetical protein